MNIELIGILATLFVLASFITSGEIKIRAVNIVGAILFVIYGWYLDAFSVYALNAVLVFVHIYKLIKLVKGEKYEN